MSATDFTHGTLNGYNNRHCRCPLCRSANAKYQQDRKAKATADLRASNAAVTLAAPVPAGLTQILIEAQLAKQEAAMWKQAAAKASSDRNRLRALLQDALIQLQHRVST